MAAKFHWFFKLTKGGVKTYKRYKGTDLFNYSNLESINKSAPPLLCCPFHLRRLPVQIEILRLITDVGIKHFVPAHAVLYVDN